MDGACLDQIRELVVCVLRGSAFESRPPPPFVPAWPTDPPPRITKYGWYNNTKRRPSVRSIPGTYNRAAPAPPPRNAKSTGRSFFLDKPRVCVLRLFHVATTNGGNRRHEKGPASPRPTKKTISSTNSRRPNHGPRRNLNTTPLRKYIVIGHRDIPLDIYFIPLLSSPPSPFPSRPPPPPRRASPSSRQHARMRSRQRTTTTGG